MLSQVGGVRGRAMIDQAASADGAPSPATRLPAVELQGVTAGYRKRVALEQVSLVVPSGAMVAIVGPNGGGKSTLLKLLLGTLQPWRGSVRVFGSPPSAARLQTGYVPQSGTGDWSFPATVGEVVMMGRCRRIGWL